MDVSTSAPSEEQKRGGLSTLFRLLLLIGCAGLAYSLTTKVTRGDMPEGEATEQGPILSSFNELSDAERVKLHQVVSSAFQSHHELGRVLGKVSVETTEAREVSVSGGSGHASLQVKASSLVNGRQLPAQVNLSKRSGQWQVTHISYDIRELSDHWKDPWQQATQQYDEKMKEQRKKAEESSRQFYEMGRQELKPQMHLQLRPGGTR